MCFDKAEIKLQTVRSYNMNLKHLLICKMTHHVLHLVLRIEFSTIKWCHNWGVDVLTQVRKEQN